MKTLKNPLNYSQLTDQCHSFQAAMLSSLGRLIEHESPSDNKNALDALAVFLAEQFRATAGSVTLLPNDSGGDHIRVICPASDGSASTKPALILCHFDTVWPLGSLAKMPFRVEGDKAHGPGILDMKASLVITEFALRTITALGASLPRPITILLTSDEEVGSPTSRSLIEDHARDAEFVLVMEPALPGGALKTSRKGVGRFTLEVEGRAAHAGIEPELGISAVTELSHQVLRLHALSAPSAGTTVNVGVVDGGTKPNVIAAYARAQTDVRAWTSNEAARLETAILGAEPATNGAVIRTSGGFYRPPMERTPAIADLFKQVQVIGGKLGMELEEGAAGGGSDGNFTSALGIPTLDGLGAMGHGMHADHEHILIDSLPKRVALLTALLCTL